MNKFKSVAILILFVAPVILFGYQNCANIENASISGNFDDSNSPIIFSSLSPLGYNLDPNCEALPDGPVVMINSERHLCAVSKTVCHLSALESDGYSLDVNSACENATDYNSSELNNSFSDSTADELGYVSNPNVMCTYQIQTLVNIKTRTCVVAKDGCEASYLKKQKDFTKDTASFCLSDR